MKFIPYGKHFINQNDINEVIKILKSDFLTQGPTVEKFERSVRTYCNSQYSVAVNSATSALHLACKSLGLKENDYVWTSPNSFVASANCALYCGAKIDFVDIDQKTWCMSSKSLRLKLELHRVKNLPLPKIVIPVHLGGQSCEMEKIKELSNKFGFKIIEDASHAIGGYYKNTPVGSCSYSDLTVFSFHPVKIITSGEGGMILTNNQKLYQKLFMLRTHGITKSPKDFVNDNLGPWYYEQIDLGFNYRITDIQAALGLSQMNKLDYFTKRRNLLASKYNELLEKTEFVIQKNIKDTYSSRHLYIIRVPKKIHKNIFCKLRKLGIGVNLHYLPIHLHPFYKTLGFKVGQFPEAEKYSKEAISLPLFPKLTLKNLSYIVKSLKDIYNDEIKKN